MEQSREIDRTMATTQMIRTEPPPAQPRWTGLSGTILDGGYELQDLWEATDTQARFKVRVLGDRDLESVAVLFQLPEAEIERQIELWQNVKRLRHPHISAPLGAGRWELDGTPLAYAVLRRADEALSVVLRERSLTAEEAGETFASITRALEALHLNGWAHGCLSPDLVLAVGDYIQLPGECVRTVGVSPVAQMAVAKYLAPESVKANLTPEADLWCLGATLFEALTQKSWTEESREELEALPEPFAAIAFRCLEPNPKARCSLAEATALYRGELKLPPRVRVAATPALIVPAQEITPAPELPSMPVSQPSEPKKEQLPQTKLFVEGATNDAEKPALNALIGIKEAADTKPLSVNKGEVRPPQTIAEAAPAPDSKKGAIPLSNSDAYTQPKPSLVARPDAEETRRRSADEEKAVKGVNRMWLWAAGVVLLIVALLWFSRTKQQAPAANPSSSSTPSRPAAEQSGSKGNVWQTRTLGPGTPATAGSASRTGSVPHNGNTVKPVPSSSGASHAMQPSPHSQNLKTFQPESATTNKNVWRVILYTYNRSADAERKAKGINARHSGLHAEVFSPSGSSGPYLVTTEGQPSRQEALQARRRAVGAGMPRDAYIQNYSK